MELSGDRLIAAPKAKVWDALNDPDVLKACIPGCESLEKRSDTEMQAVAARFIGKLQISDIDPPNGYTISGDGQGGAAGNAKLKLTDAQGGTNLAYVVNAQLGGDMAALETSAIDDFFTKFSAILAPAAAPQTAGTNDSAYHGLHEDHDHDPSNPHYFGLPIGVIIAATVAAVAVGLTLYKFIL